MSGWRMVTDAAGRAAVICGACGGSGVVVVETSGDGWHQTSSELCSCRRNLPPRDGQAAWWTDEIATAVEVTDMTGLYGASVIVRPERPVSADGFPLIRRGNRYWPTCVDIEVEGGGWMVEDARRLAEAILRACETAERIDGADSSACGHWSPCECPDPPLCPWCGRRMSACQCEDDEVGF